MSLVAEGPLIQVVGRDGSSRRTAAGTSSTTWSARTTQTWRSGTSVSTRRPYHGACESTMVPVVAIATVAVVTTAVVVSRSVAVSPSSGTAPGTAYGYQAGTKRDA